MKICTKCGVEKEESKFGTSLSGGKRWVRPDCFVCNAAAAKAYRVKHPEKAKIACEKWRQDHPHKRLEYSRKAKYGVSLARYSEMLRTQEGRCASCGDLFSDNKKTKPHVDHCHSTKKVRGLLCYHCNVGIGLFKDSSMRLLLAIRYLTRR